MKNRSLLPEIKALTKNLLESGDDFLLLKESADSLYRIFSSITGIEVNSLKNDEIILPSGKAISSASAAHCLIEFKRTAVFLRGIYKAIQQKKKGEKQPVQILYAGCGPYATLITPLLSLFQQGDVNVTLIDVNDKSLNSAKTLIEYLGFGAFINDFLLTDAVTFNLDKEYDVIISETMRSCLEGEPLPHILHNLAPQMPGEAIFIPERVTIDAYLTDPDLELARMRWENRDKGIIDKIFIGKIFDLDLQNYDEEKLKGEVVIPEDIGSYFELNLFTTVQVFGDDILKERDCSLTLPKKFYDFQKSKYVEKTSFWLDMTGHPKIDCKIIEYAEE